MTPWFFGYGSLVNTATHDYPAGAPARLDGWRRIWVRSATTDHVFLSIHPVAHAQIDGLIAQVPGRDWAALDLREAQYDRFDVTAAVCHDTDAREIAAYAVPGSGQAPPATAAHAIALSYLDVVVQGFARVYGAAGAAAFFDTTDGWDVPVIDDRAAPRYPRAQPLDAAERARTDRLLAQVQ